MPNGEKESTLRLGENPDVAYLVHSRCGLASHIRKENFMNKIKSLKKLKIFLQNQPLIEAESSVAALKPNILDKKNGSLFFGVGVVSSKDISVAVPFDILAMFFEAEILRQALGLKKVMVLIGDIHAKSNHIFPDQKIDKISNKTLHVLQKIIKNFNLQNFQLFMASRLFRLPAFQEIFMSLPNFDNLYLKHEVADCLFFQETENLRLKLGWTMHKGIEVIGHDERFFDQEIDKFCPDLSFIHLKSGHTFNKNRPRVSPYLRVKGEKRILLKKNEKVKEKIEEAVKEWPDRSLGGAINHLASIVRAFERLNGGLLKMTLAEKIQFILDMAVS